MKKKDREEIDSAIAGFFVSSRNRYAAAWPSNNTTIYMDLEEVFSVSLRIRYLEFYLPLYSMDLLTPPSLSFCPLFSLTPYSFLLSFPRTGRALRRPLTRTTRIALPGISEVLSRIQRLHRPSWMDRQSSLTLRLSAPPPLSLSSSLHLPPCSPALASLSLSLSPPPPSSSSLLPPVLFPPSLSNHSMRDYILRLDTREKFTSFDAP